MASGYDVYRHFGDVRSDVERDRRGMSEVILGLQGEKETLLREQAGLWRKFAAFQIDADVALPSSVIAALDQRREKVASKKEEVGERTRLIGVGKKQVGIFDEKIAALAAVIQAEEDAIRERFLADARVKPLYERFQVLEGAEKNLQDNLDRAVAERDTKRTAYEADEHFMYLRARKFGTAAYSSFFPFVRALDRRLANALNFPEANSDYEQLLSTPDGIVERLDNQKPEHEKVHAALTVLEHEFFDVTKPKHEELDDLKLRRQQVIDQTDQHGRELTEINQFLADAATSDDADLKKIVSQFADQVARLGFSTLKDMAEKTSSDEDNAILVRVQRIVDELADLDGQLDVEKQKLSACDQKLAGLRRIENEIESRNWNGSGHSFSGIDAADLAGAFLRGMLSESSIIGQLGSSHRNPPPPPSLPRSSGSGYGGFGSGGFGRTTGGFGGSSSSRSTGGFGGGGGHKTTGGFGG